MAAEISTVDIESAVAAMSQSRRKQYKTKAASRGLSLREYLATKLDMNSIAKAKNRLARLKTTDVLTAACTAVVASPSAPAQAIKPAVAVMGKENVQPQQEIIVIPDDEEESIALPPAKRLKTDRQRHSDASYLCGCNDCRDIAPPRPPDVMAQRPSYEDWAVQNAYLNVYEAPQQPQSLAPVAYPTYEQGLPPPQRPVAQHGYWYPIDPGWGQKMAPMWPGTSQHMYDLQSNMQSPMPQALQQPVYNYQPNIQGTIPQAAQQVMYDLQPYVQGPTPTAWAQEAPFPSAPARTAAAPTAPLPAAAPPTSTAQKVGRPDQTRGPKLDVSPSRMDAIQERTPPSSQVTRDTRSYCTCGVVAVPGATNVVTCAAPTCGVGDYHLKCVGLATREPPLNWRCWKCRAKPPPQQPTQFVTSSEPVLPFVATEPQLSAEQERVVDLITSGKNVFYTGSAGTGKSTVLKAFVDRLKKEGKKVDIVAPSGIAAIAIGGTTIFAYAGWTPDKFKMPLSKLASAGHGKNVKKRLCKTDVLVIDEISMVESDLLVRLDRLMREARHGWRPDEGEGPSRSPHRGNLPFGGVQIVVTGDFCQLPPVKPFKYCLYCGGDELKGWAHNDGGILRCQKCRREFEDKNKWAFASEVWTGCDFEYIELSKIHRQSDKRFIDLLQTCRDQRPLSKTQQDLLLAPKPDPVAAVKLMPTRAEVDRENNQQFRALPGRTLPFNCRDMFDWKNKDEPELKWKGEPKYSNRPDGPLKALKDHRFEEHVDLKQGMLVILLVNLDFTAGLVNGSQGRIVGFEEYDPKKILVPTKPVESSSKSSRRRQRSPSPGRHHGRDSQGRFLPGHNGIGLNGPGLEETLGEFGAIKNEEIHAFMRAQAIQQWPVVEFTNGVKRTIYASCQLNQLGVEEPYSLLGRTQIPLLASWAITCHKSQGMTLSRVIVDLHNSFERGMVYVALSRARNLEGLKVVRLPKALNMPGNEEVKVWLTEKFGKK